MEALRFIVASIAAALSVQAFHASSQPLSMSVRNELIAAHEWHGGCPVSFSGLRVITLTYWGFDKRVHTGQMVVNAQAVAPLTTVFRKLYELRFPIHYMS